MVWRIKYNESDNTVTYLERKKIYKTSSKNDEIVSVNLLLYENEKL